MVELNDGAWRFHIPQATNVAWLAPAQDETLLRLAKFLAPWRPPPTNIQLRNSGERRNGGSGAASQLPASQDE